MAAKIDINADMGESYGRWTLGHDADLMPFLSSANIACGYHGGDPHVMRTTVRLAKKHGRSEEHTSELQSRLHLVCRLLLEKKKEPIPLARPSALHATGDDTA